MRLRCSPIRCRLRRNSGGKGVLRQDCRPAVGGLSPPPVSVSNQSAQAIPVATNPGALTGFACDPLLKRAPRHQVRFIATDESRRFGAGHPP